MWRFDDDNNYINTDDHNDDGADDNYIHNFGTNNNDFGANDHNDYRDNYANNNNADNDDDHVRSAVNIGEHRRSIQSLL
jgi:hypothetical protein